MKTTKTSGRRGNKRKRRQTRPGQIDETHFGRTNGLHKTTIGNKEIQRERRKTQQLRKTAEIAGRRSVAMKQS